MKKSRWHKEFRLLARAVLTAVVVGLVGGYLYRQVGFGPEGQPVDRGPQPAQQEPRQVPSNIPPAQQPTHGSLKLEFTVDPPGPIEILLDGQRVIARQDGPKAKRVDSLPVGWLGLTVLCGEHSFSAEVRIEAGRTTVILIGLAKLPKPRPTRPEKHETRLPERKVAAGTSRPAQERHPPKPEVVRARNRPPLTEAFDRREAKSPTKNTSAAKAIPDRPSAASSTNWSKKSPRASKAAPPPAPEKVMVPAYEPVQAWRASRKLTGRRIRVVGAGRVYATLSGIQIHFQHHGEPLIAASVEAGKMGGLKVRHGDLIIARVEGILRLGDKGAEIPDAQVLWGCPAFE
jgi:hypothetical protein